MWEQVLANLMNTGLGVAIFIVAYLSNVCFSLWYNIKILNQPFDIIRLRDGGLKILSFAIGLILLTGVITTLPIFADTVGWTIPDEYKEIFANLVIIGSFLLASLKYIVEAYTKMKTILFYTPE